MMRVKNARTSDAVAEIEVGIKRGDNEYSDVLLSALSTRREFPK